MIIVAAAGTILLSRVRLCFVSTLSGVTPTFGTRGGGGEQGQTRNCEFRIRSDDTTAETAARRVPRCTRALPPRQGRAHSLGSSSLPEEGWG